MRSAAPSQTGVLLARLAGLIILLALVVAPACAPLCAAQICVQGHASTEMGCHSHGAANGDVVYFQSVQSCGAPELQAANLPSADKRGPLQKVRAATASGELGLLSLVDSLMSATGSAPTDANLESPPQFCCAISIAILRI